MDTNILHRGDCLDIMKLMDDKSIDMILCDLPYGTTKCSWDVTLPIESLWIQYKRIIKDKGVIVLTASQPFTSFLITSNIKMFKYCWVWVKNKKTGFLNSKKQPLRQTEDIVVFYSSNSTYNPQKTVGHKKVNSFTKHRGDGKTVGKTLYGFKGGGQTDRYPSNVIYTNVVNNDNSKNDKYIPTQKPVALFEYLIKTYTNEGELVLDNCAGSGTTAIACINTKRNYILIEKEEKHCQIIKNRIFNLSKIKNINEMFI